jgi:hypothetical protein
MNLLLPLKTIEVLNMDMGGLDMAVPKVDMAVQSDLVVLMKHLVDLVGSVVLVDLAVSDIMVVIMAVLAVLVDSVVLVVLADSVDPEVTVDLVVIKELKCIINLQFIRVYIISPCQK